MPSDKTPTNINELYEDMSNAINYLNCWTDAYKHWEKKVIDIENKADMYDNKTNIWKKNLNRVVIRLPLDKLNKIDKLQDEVKKYEIRNSILRTRLGTIDRNSRYIASKVFKKIKKSIPPTVGKDMTKEIFAQIHQTEYQPVAESAVLYVFEDELSMMRLEKSPKISVPRIPRPNLGKLNPANIDYVVSEQDISELKSTLIISALALSEQVNGHSSVCNSAEAAIKRANEAYTNMLNIGNKLEAAVARDKTLDYEISTLEKRVESIRSEISDQIITGAYRIPREALWIFYDKIVSRYLKKANVDTVAMKKFLKIQEDIIEFADDEFSYINLGVTAIAHGDSKDIEKIEQLVTDRRCEFIEAIDIHASVLPESIISYFVKSTCK